MGEVDVSNSWNLQNILRLIVCFFMVNWIIQRHATNEKASLSSLQVRCDLHSNEQTQSDYNLLVFMHTHTHKHLIIWYVFPSIFSEMQFFAEKQQKKMYIPSLPQNRPVQRNTEIYSLFLSQGNSKAARCAWVINCPRVAQQLHLRPVHPQALVLTQDNR